MLEARFDPDPHAPASARHALDRLASRVPPKVLDDIRLLVSELVTNSVRHALLGTDGWIRLRVKVDRRSVRVEVSDPGVGFEDMPSSPTLYQDHGWGLYLVEQVADRWGHTRNGEMRVWFEIDLASHGSA